jgi:hypothetical protein
VAAALNDPRRSRIADPRKGTSALAFPSADVRELACLAQALDSLGVVYQTNYSRAELVDRAERAFLTIYDREDQKRLLEDVGKLLEGSRARTLEDLVAARGPIPEPTLRRMEVTIERGMSHAYLADALNREGIITGMGTRKWTEKKVRAALKSAARR